MRRPDRLKATVRKAETDIDREFFYDGKTFTVYGKNVKYYASVPAPATIAELVHAVQERFDVQLPLADLFPTDGPDHVAALSLVDPRLRLAADLYNLGLTLGLSTPDRDHVLLEVGRQPLPFGTLTLAIDPEQFVWGGYRMGDFIPVAECKLRGLRNRYRQPGVGAPHELSKGGLDSALRQTYMRHGRGLQGSAAAYYCQ